MIHVERPQAPKILRSPRWMAEKKRATDFFARPVKERSQMRFEFNFKLLRHPEVMQALEALFYGKCAFCETRYKAVSTMNLEHFRPKGNAVGQNGVISRDHYWWLAYEWFNLYPVCQACNIAKGSRFPVIGERAAIGCLHAGSYFKKCVLGTG